MAPILSILAILTVLALIWAAIESRKPRAVLGGGMPSPVGEGVQSSEDAMRDALIVGRGLKPKDWESMRDKVIFVHDDLGDAELAQILASFGEYEAVEQLESLPPTEAEAEDEQAPAARERFRSELDARGLLGRVEPLGTFYAPGPFDAYRVRERV